MKTIYYRDLDKIVKEKTKDLSSVFTGSFGYLTRIQDSCLDDRIKFGINWSACGTQSVEATECFIEELEEAVKVANELNEMFKDTEVVYSR